MLVLIYINKLTQATRKWYYDEYRYVKRQDRNGPGSTWGHTQHVRSMYLICAQRRAWSSDCCISVKYCKGHRSETNPSGCAYVGCVSLFRERRPPPGLPPAGTRHKYQQEWTLWNYCIKQIVGHTHSRRSKASAASPAQNYAHSHTIEISYPEIAKGKRADFAHLDLLALRKP